MKFLLYTTTYGKSGSIQLSRPGFWVPALAGVCALLIGAGRVGYLLAGAEPAGVAQLQGSGGPAWQTALKEQKQELVQARDAAQDQLNALAVRLGQMQAQMLRVEALGQRLAEQAKLDKSEFDFDQLPARGGPAEPLQEDQPGGVDFMRALDDLALQLDDRTRQLEVLEQVISQRQLKHAISPAGRPIRKGWLSSYFGKRTDPFTGRREMHKGLDFAGQSGADVLATAAGVVTWAGKRYGYGQLVEINHGSGVATRYGHCKEILVKVGQRVKQGETIALMGSTGRSTGPHVHYEVLKNGQQVNPARYVQSGRQPSGG
jgi:murein DD-endopeptidase MepM/ murein hydrolase activator NlpD